MLLYPCALMLLISAWVMRGLPHDVSSAPVASREFPRFQPGCMAATAAIALPGWGLDGEADGDGDGGRETDGDGEGDPTFPVHVVPLRANEAGAVFVPDHEPLNPNDCVPLVGIEAL